MKLSALFLTAIAATNPAGAHEEQDTLDLLEQFLDSEDAGLELVAGEDLGEGLASAGESRRRRRHRHGPHGHSPHRHSPHVHTPFPTPHPTETPTLYPTPSPTAYPTSSPTAYPTPSPTTYPTPSPTTYPTSSPTAAPTQHPCENGEHGCDKSPGGKCHMQDGDSFTCSCAAPGEISGYHLGYWCSAGCETQSEWQTTANYAVHVCTPVTSAPTAYPTPAPTAYPTPAPTAYPTPSPTTYPTPSPTTYPTPYPTSSPTTYPTPSPTTYPTPYPTPSPTTYPTPYPTTTPTPAPTPYPTHDQRHEDGKRCLAKVIGCTRTGSKALGFMPSGMLRDVGKVKANNGHGDWGIFGHISLKYLTAQVCFNAVWAQAQVACGVGTTSVEMRYEDGHEGCRDTHVGCPLKVSNEFVAYPMSQSSGCMGPKCHTMHSGDEETKVHSNIVQTQANLAFSTLDLIHQKDVNGKDVHYDRHYDLHKARACCQKKCGSTGKFDEHKRPILNGCAKGCTLWVGHTNLNWIKKYESKLHDMCKATCDKVSKGRRRVDFMDVDESEMEDCKSGCTKFHECSYTKEGEMPASTKNKFHSK